MKKWLVATTLLLILVVLLMLVVKKDEPRVVGEVVPTPTKVVQKREKEKIGIVADIHDDVASLSKAINLMKNDGVEQVVVAGDLTINGTKDELEKVKETLDNSGLNYLVVPGNHDLYRNKFSEVFGKEWQSKILGNLKLILINNANWRGLGDEQKKWIEQESPDCIKITCLVVMHKPLGHYLTPHVMGENNEKVTKEAGWLNDWLVKNGVTKVFVGHLHFNSIYTYTGLETNVVGAISKERNNQTPRLVEVISYEIDGQSKQSLESRMVEVE